MAENIIKNEVLNHGEGATEVANWISQINAGGTVYDIATHHGITFKDGKNDGTGVKWNGLTDLEIVIPNITDIVQTPIEFAGTVSENEKITWVDGHGETAEKGNLVFITADCTFAGKACEAGDMAIYDGKNWNVVSGENQVELVGTVEDNKVTVAVGAAADVLTVEGKTLALTLDYADLNKNHLDVTKAGSAAAAVPVKFGNMTVGSKFINLTKDADKSQTIGKAQTIKKATQLKNGEVTFTGTDALVTGVSWGAFNQGSLSELVMNTDERSFNVSGGSLTTTTDEDFVTGVTLGNVTFGESTQGTDGAFALVGGIQPGEGKSFVTGVKDAEGNVKTEFTVAGCYQPNVEKFVTGLVGGITDVVTSFDAGLFAFNSKGSTFVTGFNDDSTDVISSVTVSANNDTSVLATATVSDHVLSFASVNVASGVTASTSTKSLVKGGYDYVAPSVGKTSLTTDGFTMTSAVKYTFDTAKETTYTTTSSYYKLTTPELVVSKAGYALSNDGMVAKVSANTFGVSLSGGVLPTLGESTLVYKADVKGSVETGLDYEDVSINTVDESAMTITLPGAYSLEDNTTTGVSVGVAGELTSKNATIDLSNFVTDVAIVDTKS